MNEYKYINDDPLNKVEIGVFILFAAVILILFLYG